jgi:hypothetical protein
VTATDDHVVDFPTLGFLVADWKEAHCTIPDGFRMGEPFVETDWQLWATVNHYRVKRSATVGQLAPAFHFRRSQIVLPQKAGKGPWSASDALAQASGPVLFAGWAEGGEVYDCRDFGCGCGFVYEYEPGEPMGQPWPTPLIQVTAFSEDQAANIWRPLQAMVKAGPLADLMRVGEEFVRVGDLGRVDKVTSSAKSRLGQPITAAYQDEVGLWTKQSGMVAVAETQRRGLAGMGGRAVETTNAFDPSEDSVAQRTFESRAADVFRLFPQADAALSFGDKRERRKILRQVYRGVPWVDLDAIEAEALELMEKDRPQAERFFGNRLVATADAWCDESEVAHFLSLSKRLDVPKGTRVTLGFDGSQYDDWTAIRGRALFPDGSRHAFTPRFADGKPTWWNPAEHGGEVPRGEVQAAVEELFDRFEVVRMNCDPELWQSEIDAWAVRWPRRVVVWPTYRNRPMAEALERWKVDAAQSRFTNDGDDVMLTHLRNARRVRRPGGVVIGKPTQHQKIDLVMADALAHEAASEVPATRKRRGITVH